MKNRDPRDPDRIPSALREFARPDPTPARPTIRPAVNGPLLLLIGLLSILVLGWMTFDPIQPMVLAPTALPTRVPERAPAPPTQPPTVAPSPTPVLVRALFSPLSTDFVETTIPPDATAVGRFSTAPTLVLVKAASWDQPLWVPREALAVSDCAYAALSDLSPQQGVLTPCTPTP